MGKVIGVTCHSNSINVAVWEHDTVLDGFPERIIYAVGLEENTRLWALFEEFTHVLDIVRPDKVVVLAPETTYKATHSQLTHRIAAETIVRMAATKAGVLVEMLARQTVRSRLELPRGGQLDSYLGTVFDQPVGRYWSSGRGVAAMAAAAGGRA